MSRKRKGFTLIEIIIVLAVLGMIFGVLLNSFILSIRMNKRAINTDMARTLAESKVEELKDISPSLFKYGDTTTVESIFYDKEWQSTDEKNASFKLQAQITKTSIKDRMNVFKPNTYIEGSHHHLMSPQAPYTLIVVAPNGSNSYERKYLVGAIDSEINDHIFDMFVESFNENSQKNLNAEEFGKEINKVIMDANKKNTAYAERQGKYKNYNPYYVGKKKNASYNSSEKGNIANRLDERDFGESLPIKVYFDEKALIGYDHFQIQILNLTDQNIDFFIDYARDFSQNRDPKSVVQAEVVGGLPTPFQTGNVNIIYTYTRQKNDSDDYQITVTVENLKEKEMMIQLDNTKYDNLYER